DNSWSIFYIEKNDTDQLQPQIHGRLDGLSYAYYYKYEGLINGEYQTLEEGVGSTEQHQIIITNTTFMNSYGNYTIRCTFSSTGVTRTETFVKTLRTSYQTPDLTLLPNDNGTVTDDDITANGATYKWQCIDDGSSHDSDTTYIEGGTGEETFNFEDTISSIKYLKIVIVSRATGGTYNRLYVTLKSNFQLTRIAKINVDNTNYQTFVIYITKNPFTNENWTANDLSNLEVGLYFDPAMAIPSPKIRCTSLYIEGAIRNTPPTLSNPSATPSSGVADYTIFYFNITYSDPNGDPPVEIKVNISKTGWYINVTMTYVSGDNTTGALYSYSTTLSTGVYDYLFYASDGEASTVNDPTDQVSVEAQSYSFTVSTADPSGQENFTASATMSAEWNVDASYQTSSIPAIQITNTGNVPINISINLTTTPISNVHIKYNTSSTPPSFTTDPYSCDKELTTTPVQVAEYLQPGDTLNIWLWADFENKYNPGEYTTSLWIESSGAT
ncbi:MAG: hypothetical protein DRP18_03685, partial [Candidatus Aenigmatarchaeota archaeon]